MLVGKKVCLCPLSNLKREEEAAEIEGWINDQEITKFMFLGTFPNNFYSIRKDLELIMGDGLTQGGAHPTTIIMGIYHKIGTKPSKLIGYIGFFGINWVQGVAELRVLIGRQKFWGEGYCDEAYRLFLTYGFDRLNLRKIMGGTRADHVQSVVALRKVGFVQEGRYRKQFLRNGKEYDTLSFGLLREDFLCTEK